MAHPKRKTKQKKAPIIDLRGKIERPIFHHWSGAVGEQPPAHALISWQYCQQRANHYEQRAYHSDEDWLTTLSLEEASLWYTLATQARANRHGRILASAIQREQEAFQMRRFATLTEHDFDPDAEPSTANKVTSGYCRRRANWHLHQAFAHVPDSFDADNHAQQAVAWFRMAQDAKQSNDVIYAYLSENHAKYAKIEKRHSPVARLARPDGLPERKHQLFTFYLSHREALGDVKQKGLPNSMIETPYGAGHLSVDGDGIVTVTVREPVTLYQVKYQVKVQGQIQRDGDWHFRDRSRRAGTTTDGNATSAASRALRAKLGVVIRDWYNQHPDAVARAKTLDMANQIAKARHALAGVIRTARMLNKYLDILEMEYDAKGFLNQEDMDHLRQMQSYHRLK